MSKMQEQRKEQYYNIPSDKNVFQERDFASSLFTDRPFEPENPVMTAENALKSTIATALA